MKVDNSNISNDDCYMYGLILGDFDVAIFKFNKLLFKFTLKTHIILLNLEKYLDDLMH